MPMFKRACVVLAVVFASSCNSGSTSSSTPTPTPTGTTLVRVHGSVFDFQTNAGVPNATIRFYISGLNATAGTVVTDQFGFYALSLSRGIYNPRINGSDVDSNRGTIRPIGALYLADYFVNGANCVMFYGTIRDATTAGPVGGATLKFIGNTTQSGSDGSYRLDLGCPTVFAPYGTGTVFMQVSSPGYVPQQPYGNRAEFVPGDGLQRIDVSLQPVS